MRVALVKEFGGISSVELSEWPDPTPTARQAVVRVDTSASPEWLALIGSAPERSLKASVTGSHSAPGM